MNKELFDMSTSMNKDLQLSVSMYGNLDDKPISSSNVSPLDLRQMADDLGKFIKGSEDISLKDISVSVKDGCISLCTNGVIDSPSLIHDYKVLYESMNPSEDVDPVRAAVIKNMQSLSKGNSDRKYVISYMGTKITIDSESDYTINEPVYVDIEDYIYGELYDMGGQTPNVHVITEDGDKVTVPADKDLLMNAGDRLYRKQLLYVSAKENIKTGERKDYQLLAFEDYKPKYDANRFEELLEFYTPQLASITNPERLVSIMRGY